ncbi:hypothetical protein JYT15_00890 [Acidimicrobium ferrooxidans]|nr:hypothetical protein [Acidimicrobium ferrooxidans]
MGGFIGTAISGAAVAIFLSTRQYLLGALACLPTVLVFVTWRLMWYHAKLLARNTAFLRICDERSLEHGSKDAAQVWEDLWSQAGSLVSDRDVQDVPDWIASTNMIASVIGTGFLVWALVIAV